jgi:hypothetical protein
VTPVRVQLRRTSGWRMPPNTVSVARPSRWGNPWRVCDPLRNCEHEFCCTSGEAAVSHYKAGVLGYPESGDPPVPDADEVRRLLAGKNLACWCPLEDGSGYAVPCHADVLLAIANGWER